MVMLSLFLLLIAGAGGTLQGGVGYKIMDKTGSSYLAGAGFTLLSIPSFIIIIYFLGDFPELSQFMNIPLWCLLAALCQVLFFITITICPPVTGVALLAVGMLIGQILGGVIIDEFGLLGMAARPISTLELLGCVILVAGGSMMAFLQDSNTSESEKN